MSGISTHILDTALGRPAAGVEASLLRLALSGWQVLATARTDADGRIKPLLAAEHVKPGTHRLDFHVAPYFERLNQATLYPEISITFTVAVGQASYHIPLLLNPFGYTTYRGS